jgi:hypothetical protein
LLLVTFALSTMSFALLFRTEVGQFALIDRWERAALAFGRDVNDDQYARLEALSHHGAAYAALRGGLQGPVLALALATLIRAWFGSSGSDATYRQVLAVVVHAGVILMFRDLVSAPLDYVRETLASPATLSTFLPIFDDASPIARFLAMIDLFVVWWALVLAIGVSVIYRRRMRSVVVPFIGAYIGAAAVLAIAMAMLGGTV